MPNCLSSNVLVSLKLDRTKCLCEGADVPIVIEKTSPVALATLSVEGLLFAPFHLIRDQAGIVLDAARLRSLSRTIEGMCLYAYDE